MMMQTAYSKHHHVILISKRKFRLFCALVLTVFAAFFFVQSNNLFFARTAVFQIRVEASSSGSANSEKRQQRNEPNNNDTPAKMFPSSKLEELVCWDAKHSGKCLFEQRHLPPRFSFLEATAKVKNLTKDDKLNQKAAVGLFSKLSSQVALVITFNRATNYEVAPFVEAFYRSMFAKIIFCGPMTAAEQFRLVIERYHGSDVADYMKNSFVSYRPDIPDLGENLYMCFNLAMSSENLLGGLAESGSLLGVFMMGDDVLLNYWNLFHPVPYPTSSSSSSSAAKSVKLVSNILTGDLFDFEKSHVMDVGVIYDTTTLKACQRNVNTCELPNPWPNWPNMFQIETNNFYENLEALATNSSNSKIYGDCLNGIIAKSGGKGRVLQSPSDFFYIARQHFISAMVMFELANKHKVFQEVAVQTTFACFDEATRLRLDSSSDNTDGVNRKMPWAGYRTDWLFMHPFKLSLVASQDERVRNFYLNDRCLFCMLSEFSKQFRYSLEKNVQQVTSSLSSPPSSEPVIKSNQGKKPKNKKLR